MSDIDELKKEYRLLERNVLLLIMVPLPVFSYAYLYTTGKSKDLLIPNLPDFLDKLLLVLAVSGLLLQYMRFRKRLIPTRDKSLAFNERFISYVQTTMERYWILLAVGLICAAGLFFFQNPGFTIAYAVCLIVVSLGKPSPDRIVSALRLKKEERDKVYEIVRREDL